MPEKRTWFIAEVLVLSSIGERASYVLHNNFVLIKACDAESAIRLAESRGRNYDDSYVNTDKHVVTVRFIGLRNLSEIYDELEDGAEILYEELLPASEAEALAFVRSKESFAAFRRH